MSAVRGCTCTDPRKLVGKHKCTPGRPRCRRTDVTRNRTCLCAGLPYPHRSTSLGCLANERTGAKLNDLAYGSVEETVPF